MTSVDPLLITTDPNPFDVLPTFVIVPVCPEKVAACPLTKLVQLPPVVFVRAEPSYVLDEFPDVQVAAFFPILQLKVLLVVPSLKVWLPSAVTLTV